MVFTKDDINLEAIERKLKTEFLSHFNKRTIDDMKLINHKARSLKVHYWINMNASKQNFDEFLKRNNFEMEIVKLVAAREDGYFLWKLRGNVENYYTFFKEE